MPATDGASPRARPISATLGTEAGRDAYLAENGFSVAAYDEPWTEASFLGIPFKVPNPPRHRWAIMRHDLHHVATGYGTDLIGEAEVSAWELACGGYGLLDVYTRAIVTQIILVGLVAAPRRTVAAWRAAKPGARSLFHDRRPYPEVLSGSVGELRARLGVPPEGLAQHPRLLHSRAPRS
ncbi:MAG: hypothetical protein U0610_32140 [bacterium]